MTSSNPIDLKFSKQNLVTLLKHGLKPDESPYTHKQIAEWAERFWNTFSEVDAADEIENIMPILADIETQRDLYLASISSSEGIGQDELDEVRLPTKWFETWASEVESV
ncbi:hypothetical protein [Vreelandella sp. TE19]